MARRLTEIQIVSLAIKAGNTQANPRLSDLRAAVFGGQGRLCNELSYLMDQNNSTNQKLTDNWEQYQRSKSVAGKPLTEGRIVFFTTQTLD